MLDQSAEIATASKESHEALQAARDRGEPETLAAALIHTARVTFRMGQYEAAQDLAREVLGLVAADSPAQVDAWQVLANCAAETHSLEEAETCFQAAADLARQVSYHRGRVAALHGLAAAVYVPRGLFDLALAADEEVRRIALTQDRPDWLVYPLTNIAMACYLTRRYERARAALDELHPLVSPGSIIQGYELCIGANLALDEGDRETAQALCAQARSIAEASGEPWLNMSVRLGMSRFHQLGHDGPNARAWADDAVAFARRVGYQHEQGRALIERGRAAWMLGDDLAGAADLRAAIAILSDLGAAFDLARARLLLAILLRQKQHPDAAAAWLRAVQAITSDGYAFLLDAERALALPLVAASLNHTDATLAATCATLVEYLQRVPPPPLRIVVLGRFETWKGSRLIERRALRQRRAGELLALLLISPANSLSFDQIVEALWADRAPARARVPFHHATSALRRALEPELPDRFPSRYLKVEEERVTLRLPPGSSVDWEAFRAHCRLGEWEAALDLYGGELLPEYLYAEWTVAPRQRLTLLYERALLGAAEARLEEGRFDEALDACHRLLAAELWQERAVLLGMRACQGLNDRAGALRLYRNLEKALRDELDISPSDELQVFYRSLTGR